MNEINRTNDVVVGFVCGAALGAGVALLLAPAKGTETRRRIGETARRLRHTVNNRLERVKGAMDSHASVNSVEKDVVETGRAAGARR